MFLSVEQLANELDRLRNLEFHCPGPSYPVQGPHPRKGELVTFDICSKYPECGCSWFYNVAIQIEDLEEQYCKFIFEKSQKAHTRDTF